MAVLQSGYAARYDGTTWSQPAELPSAVGGEPDSVSCPTARFCLAVDARELGHPGLQKQQVEFRRYRPGHPDGHGLGVVPDQQLLRRRRLRPERGHL
jgi:hypothetical protein